MTDIDPCEPEPFRVICVYKLPSVEITDNTDLAPELIPYDRCSEVVVDEILWTSGGLAFRTPHEQLTLHKLILHVSQKPELKKKLYLIVRCQMNSDELDAVLDDPQTSINTTLEKLDQFKFNGVEFRCDNGYFPFQYALTLPVVLALTNGTSIKFKKFVDELTKLFDNRKENGGHACPETVSIRFV